MHIRITRKGKALISRGKQSLPAQEPILQHNRIKRHPLPVDAPDPFLHTIGVMTAQGKVKASMQPKFRQINQFLRVIQQTLPKNASADRPMDIIDCGCGSAYLTFAAYHFLNDVCGLSARVTGVDADAEIIDKCRRLQHDLGWDGLEFHVSAIADFDPADTPDMVLSLHACDTATDEAIARGILWKSRVILAAPCCQHELRNQLQAPLFRPLLRHGVLEQRLSDLLTDAFRALALRIMGYRTKVVEFISPEHTSKNLMIRAESGLKPGHPESVRQYQQLKAFWQVSPSIEEMLGHQLRRFLHTP
jgi:SAM-dependent methyltransferase